MNVNIINERFPEYQNMTQQDFDNLTDQYKQKYAPLSEKEKKLLGRYYTDTMKSIYTTKKITSFDALESFLEKSNLKSITNDNLINIPYNVFVQLEERYEQEKKKRKELGTKYEEENNFKKIQTYFYRYIKTIQKISKGFTLLYDKKLNNMNAYDTIEYIEKLIEDPTLSGEHPSFISIYLVYNPGSKPFHATCIFEFESFYYEFSHYGGGSNVGSVIFETYPAKGNNIYEYGRGDSVLATKICDEEIPQNIANNITLQTLLNISMFWWSKTDACNIRTFPGSCTGLVETATILTNLNNLCNNVAVNKSVILMDFKHKKSPRRSSKRRSPKRRSPRKSSRRRSPRKSSRRRSPHKSSKRRSPRKSSKRRSPRKSTRRRSPRKSTRRRSPRKSTRRRSPRKSSKRRSPRKSSKRRSPRN
jgi:hypothetical protein